MRMSLLVLIVVITSFGFGFLVVLMLDATLRGTSYVYTTTPICMDEQGRRSHHRTTSRGIQWPWLQQARCLHWRRLRVLEVVDVHGRHPACV
jgi:hypothetical protein